VINLHNLRQLKKKAWIQSSEVIETVNAKVVTEKPILRTELEERQHLLNKIQEFNPNVKLADYYSNGEYNLEKMNTDLKYLLEKERFSR